MYPSSINPNATFFTMSSSFNQNPNPTQIDPPFFPEFPSFLVDDHIFFDQLAEGNANIELPPTNVNTSVTNTSNGISSSGTMNNLLALEGLVPEKRSKRKTSQQRRTGKKDRHSKIYTAQGLRDRRMRLSLQIARKFFDLQDMLGFDKASKTIEWLFSKSKKAIRELTLKHPHMTKNNSRRAKVSVTSEGEMIDESKTRSFVFDPVTLEMRSKARARARERTREKMLIRSKLWKEPSCIDPFQFSNPRNYMDELGYYSSPFEAGDESSSRSQEKNSPYEAISSYSTSTQTQLVNNVDMMEKCFGGSSNSSMMFDNYQNIQGFDANNYFLGFLGSSELDSARISSNNYFGLVTNMAPLAGNFHEQNPSSLFAANYSDIQSQEEYKE